jgi:hypothetical protein
LRRRRKYSSTRISSRPTSDLKITVVVVPRDEKSRINALRRARGRAQKEAKGKAKKKPKHRTGKERDEYNALRRAKRKTLNPSMHFYVAPPSR